MKSIFEKIGNVFVLHHKNCFDGTGAKMAFYMKYGERITYIPCNYGDPFPIPEEKLTKDTTVYIVDFSFDRATMDKVYSKVGELIVLDHHKTAEAELRGAPYATFDMNHSGAYLSFVHNWGTSSIPDIILDIEDGDLWKFTRPNTKAVRAALPSLKHDIWKYCSLIVPENYQKLVEEGNRILGYNQEFIDSKVPSQVSVLPFKGYKVGVMNVGHLVSEIGNTICTNKDLNVDFSITYVTETSGKVLLSFRSKGEEGSVDVSQIAKELGGGGHAAASGARADFAFLDDLYKGKL